MAEVKSKFTNGCGRKIEIPICVACGSEDLTVERGLCGYCQVVTPEKMDTVICVDCEAFKPITQFDQEDGIVKNRVCFECQDMWDDAYESHMADTRAKQDGGYVYVN